MVIFRTSVRTCGVFRFEILPRPVLWYSVAFLPQNLFLTHLATICPYRSTPRLSWPMNFSPHFPDIDSVLGAPDHTPTLLPMISPVRKVG